MQSRRLRSPGPNCITTPFARIQTVKPMALKRRNKQICVPAVLLALGCMFAGVNSSSVAFAQAANGATGPCDQIPALYQLANYTVKQITAEPMVKFVTDSSVLDQSLRAAIADQVSGAPGLWVNQRFDVVGVSFLESKFNEELELRT